MRYRSVVVLAAITSLAGCSPSSTPTPQASNLAKPAAAALAAESLDPSLARAIVACTDGFMRAVLAGDAPTAAQLLTAKALQRYAADPNVLHSLGMRVERLTVGEVRLLSPAEAAAQCLVQEQGVTTPQELCCLLKLEGTGWRVCGLACDAPGGAPTVISFEETPEDPAASPQFVNESPTTGGEARTAAQPSSAEVR
jgi:hypothetical protein